MIVDSRSSADKVEQGLEFEALVSDLSSRFINLRPGEVDREIEDALRRVCEPLGIELAVLWQWSDRPRCQPGQPMSTLMGFRGPEPLHQEQYPWPRQQMLAGRIVAISSLDGYPAEAAIDRESCRLLGIGSGLSLPVRGLA